MQQWEWSRANEKDLAKFINGDSIQLLDKINVDSLYLSKSPSGRRELVKVIYNTLLMKDIKYTLEKYQVYEARTQIVRSPYEILVSPGSGTCLDLATLFCGLCLGYRLLPQIIVMDGHAFALVSLSHSLEEWNANKRERNFFNNSKLIEGDENLEILKQLIDEEFYIAIECTGFARNQGLKRLIQEEKFRKNNGILSFDDALIEGRKQLESRSFKFAVDIAVAHYGWGLTPMNIEVSKATKRSPGEEIVLESSAAKIEKELKESINGSMIKLNIDLQPKKVSQTKNTKRIQKNREKLEHSNILSIFNLYDGKILILGEAGSGKTLTLFTLAQNLMQLARSNTDYPIPVIFNLSEFQVGQGTSNSKDENLVFVFIMAQLKKCISNEKVRKELLTNKRIILLLDGLDEMKQDLRIVFLDNLNQLIDSDLYHEKIVVCCRSDCYASHKDRKIKLNQAIKISPLSKEQVYQYLLECKDINVSKVLTKLFFEEESCLALAQTPLFLNLLIEVASNENEIKKLKLSSNKSKAIINFYVENKLEEAVENLTNKDKHTIAGKNILSSESFNYFLSDLAIHMKESFGSNFIIEFIQPSWLKSNNQRNAYKLILSFTICVFRLPYIYSLYWFLISTNTYPESYSLVISCIALVWPGIGVLLSSSVVYPVTEFKFSWQLILKFSFAHTFLSIFVLDQVLKSDLNISIGLGTIMGLFTGIPQAISWESIGKFQMNFFTDHSNEIPRWGDLISNEPNKMIQKSRTNSLIIGSVSMVIAGFLFLVFSIYVERVGDLSLIAFLYAVPFAFINSGGSAVLKGSILHFVLRKSNVIPRNYIAFLEIIKRNNLIQENGGYYRFSHPLIQQYFIEKLHELQ
jgi:NACHT domain